MFEQIWHATNNVFFSPLVWLLRLHVNWTVSFHQQFPTNAEKLKQNCIIRVSVIQLLDFHPRILWHGRGLFIGQQAYTRQHTETNSVKWISVKPPSWFKLWFSPFSYWGNNFHRLCPPPLLSDMFSHFVANERRRCRWKNAPDLSTSSLSSLRCLLVPLPPSMPRVSIPRQRCSSSSCPLGDIIVVFVLSLSPRLCICRGVRSLPPPFSLCWYLHCSGHKGASSSNVQYGLLFIYDLPECLCMGLLWLRRTIWWFFFTWFWSAVLSRILFFMRVWVRHAKATFSAFLDPNCSEFEILWTWKFSHIQVLPVHIVP